MQFLEDGDYTVFLVVYCSAKSDVQIKRVSYLIPKHLIMTFFF